MNKNVYYLYYPRYPDLYRTWRTSALAKPRPFYYKNLSKSDEPVVWNFIEESYLDCYKGFIRLSFEWCYSGGLWNIYFPGFVGYGSTTDPNNMGISQDTQNMIREWHYPLDMRTPWDDNYDDSTFDYVTSDQLGLRAAKQVKIELGNDYYVEYNPFKEIVIRDGFAVELPIPEIIARLGMKQA